MKPILLYILLYILICLCLPEYQVNVLISDYIIELTKVRSLAIMPVLNYGLDLAFAIVGSDSSDSTFNFISSLHVILTVACQIIDD